MAYVETALQNLKKVRLSTGRNLINAFYSFFFFFFLFQIGVRAIIYVFVILIESQEFVMREDDDVHLQEWRETTINRIDFNEYNYARCKNIFQKHKMQRNSSIESFYSKSRRYMVLLE